MADIIPFLPHVNASLNALAGFLLLVGYLLIRQKKERQHKLAMLSAFVVSMLFLVSYLVYHAHAGSKKFPLTAPSMIRTGYLAMLLSHIVLAATVPVLAVVTIYLGWTDRRSLHRRVAKWTFPIWMYVSVTGVLIYWMLYRVDFAPLG